MYRERGALGKGGDFKLKALLLRVVDDRFDPFGRVVRNPIGAALTTDSGRHFTNHHDSEGKIRGEGCGAWLFCASA